jgi:paraquat-inducible protein B
VSLFAERFSQDDSMADSVPPPASEPDPKPSENPSRVEASSEFPAAVVRAKLLFDPSKYVTKIWLVTAACLLLTIILVVSSIESSGPEIRISFRQGYGIQPGNRLQYRGIEVGTVTSVELRRVGGPEDYVEVVAELRPDAASFAKHGSEFWIVRPQVSLSRVAGLETVVGARYIGALPGDPNGVDKTEFEGREFPLTLSAGDAVDITIRFSRGHGLAIGDSVRHRGIVMGEVTGVALNEYLTGVAVDVRLTGSAAELARVGTRFWIERPTVSAAEIRGLDTLVGGRYLAVEPGKPDGDFTIEFDGLETPPAAPAPEGGLEIVLEAGQRGGLKRGVPILYRGVPIGHVIAVALASDAASVEARAGIDSAYRHLVRDNSVFWNSSGVGMTLGLDGVRFTADTISSIVVGGVTMATPDEPGAEVRTGHRFECLATLDKEALDWKPHLPLGADGTGSAALPSPLRASLRWERRIVIRRPRQNTGWVLPIEGGFLLGPSSLLRPVENAVEGQRLETSGQEIVVTEENSKELGNGLSLVKPESPLPTKIRQWPIDRISKPGEPVSCLIVTGGLESTVSLDSHRFIAGGEGGWSLSDSVQLSADHHGAVVVSREDGNLIGFVVVTDGEVTIAHIPVSGKSAFSF